MRVFEIVARRLSLALLLVASLAACSASSSRVARSTQGDLSTTAQGAVSSARAAQRPGLVAEVARWRQAARRGAIASTARALTGPPPSATRIHALLINGGGDVDGNLLSHVEHIEGMVDVLVARGVSPERMTLFAADGEDEGADLSVRSVRGVDPRAWLIADTSLGWRLRPRERQVTTDWRGRLSVGLAGIHPAKHDALEAWFAREGQRLVPGDTLLIYTTDHGVPNRKDPDNGGLVMWGEKLSVRALRALLETLPEGVQVTMVMSQCFSGTFASALLSEEDAPEGDRCGFFSVPRDRPAYGCYAEGRAGEAMGHGYAFIDALDTHHALSDAHDQTLHVDLTPDAPLRTSDIWIEQRLGVLAEARRVSLTALVDGALLERGPGGESWARVGALVESQGLREVETLAGVERMEGENDALLSALLAAEKHWRSASEPVAEALLAAFIEANAEWAPRLWRPTLAILDDELRGELEAELLEALDAWSQEHAVSLRRDLVLLHAQTERASTARWRAQVRAATLLRLRHALQAVAAERLLADESRALEALNACEQLAPGPAPRAGEPAARPSEPLQPFEVDREQLADLEPRLLGVSFSPARGFAEGAVKLRAVAPDSPAFRAGLKQGDVVIGPPGSPFEMEMGIKRWVLTAPRATPLELEVVRGSERFVVEIKL